jgi:ribonuclease J
MKIIIHRGSHQIGGIATEIKTKTTRILIDMGDELSLDPDFVSAPLTIPGVTDENGNCDAVLFTHYHGDHTGQMTRIRKNIPLYAGKLAKDIMLVSSDRTKNEEFHERIKTMQTFNSGEAFSIGDISITPWSIDHSACDSYLFLIEADGKRVLYTGDFRMHGFRGKALPKILYKIGKVDTLVTEGTTLSRQNIQPMKEYELQQKVKEYIDQYKYVFVLCASTNLDRICALSKAVPRGKYFICDEYQKELLKLVEKHWGEFSSLYSNIKMTTYGNNLLQKLKDLGFLMVVRDNRNFRNIISKFPTDQSIILYSMWDGYLTKPDSTIPAFLNLAGKWEKLHTGGHASIQDIQTVIKISKPDKIIPIHTDSPTTLQDFCPTEKIIIAEDGKEISIE